MGSSAAASGISLSILTAAKAWAETSTETSRVELARIAQLLYPHDVPDSVYTEIIESVLTTAASNPQLKNSLDSALSELDAATAGDFLSAGENLQLIAMNGFEEEAWFTTIQAQVLALVYNNPAIWKHIGYPGPSVQNGGYKDRGFNDIDWLPTENG